jgi:hypothetical protein
MKGGPGRSLKSLNLKWLIAIATADAILLVLFVAPDLITSATTTQLGLYRAIGAAVIPVLVLLLVNVLSSNVKAMLVYWKPLGWLPGCEAYTAKSPDRASLAGKPEDTGHPHESGDALDAIRPTAHCRIFEASYASLLAQHDIRKAGNIGDAGLRLGAQPRAALLFNEPEMLVQCPQQAVRTVPASFDVRIDEGGVVETCYAGGGAQFACKCQPPNDLTLNGNRTIAAPRRVCSVLMREKIQDGMRLADYEVLQADNRQGNARSHVDVFVRGQVASRLRLWFDADVCQA